MHMGRLETALATTTTNNNNNPDITGNWAERLKEFLEADDNEEWEDAIQEEEVDMEQDRDYNLRAKRLRK